MRLQQLNDITFVLIRLEMPIAVYTKVRLCGYGLYAVRGYGTPSLEGGKTTFINPPGIFRLTYHIR